MKIIKTSLIVLSLAVIPVFGSNYQSIIRIENIFEKLISWNSETIDVGEIPQGVPKSIKFEFKNTTDKPVFISNVKASCGCTAADYSKEPIAPKKSGFVIATYNASNTGAFTKTVTVTTSDSDVVKVLKFKGNVVKS